MPPRIMLFLVAAVIVAGGLTVWAASQVPGAAALLPVTLAAALAVYLLWRRG